VCVFPESFSHISGVTSFYFSASITGMYKRCPDCVPEESERTEVACSQVCTTLYPGIPFELVPFETHGRTHRPEAPREGQEQGRGSLARANAHDPVVKQPRQAAHALAQGSAVSASVQ
jgi:hypothetical protein